MRLSEFKAAVEALGASCIQNELMSKHTSFSVGGPADLFITVENAGIMTKLLPLAESCSVPLTVIGNGSNLLVSDKGVEGAVVKHCDRSVTVRGEKIICGAGAMLSAVSAAARDSSLGGMEFAYGIPGSIGGAVYMNAGAYGGEIKDVIESCISVDTDGTVIKREKHELMLGYRESVYKGNREVILSAAFVFTALPRNTVATSFKRNFFTGEAENAFISSSSSEKAMSILQPLRSANSSQKRRISFFATSFLHGEVLRIGWSDSYCLRTTSSVLPVENTNK